MASIIYPMLLFIFVLGAGIALMGNYDGMGNGLYDVNPPSSGIVLNSTGAQQLNQAFEDTPKSSEMNYLTLLNLAGTAIGGGVLTVLTLGPLMQSFHVPYAMAAWFISPLGIVLIFWLFEFWLGRSPE